jgi:hypothetical protein
MAAIRASGPGNSGKASYQPAAALGFDRPTSINYVYHARAARGQ